MILVDNPCYHPILHIQLILVLYLILPRYQSLNISTPMYLTEYIQIMNQTEVTIPTPSISPILEPPSEIPLAKPLSDPLSAPIPTTSGI